MIDFIKAEKMFKEYLKDYDIEDFMNHKCILLSDRKTKIAFWICVIAFIFDLIFDVSLEYIKEKGYIDILVDRIEYKNEDTKRKMEEIRKTAKKYLETKKH